VTAAVVVTLKVGEHMPMTLAARAVRAARGALRWVALDILAVLPVDESQCGHATSAEGLDRGKGLEGDAELAGRTASYGAMPLCCIAERKGTSGVSVWRAFAQAVRHLYLVASTG
jgi:hypothetical protein